MLIELMVRFNFEIADDAEVNPSNLFIDVPVDSIKLYKWDGRTGQKGVPIPSIPAKLVSFETVEGYSI